MGCEFDGLSVGGGVRAKLKNCGCFEGTFQNRRLTPFPRKKRSRKVLVRGFEKQHNKPKPLTHTHSSHFIIITSEKREPPDDLMATTSLTN